MRPFLQFDDPGAQDDHPARNVTVGDVRAWHDADEKLRLKIIQAKSLLWSSPTEAEKILETALFG